MEGYSSDGSSSFFTSKKRVDGQWMELVGFVEDKTEISAINGGLTQSLTDQDQLNQLGTSEGSYRTKSEGGRPKLSLAQKRENKRLSDYRYRQKRKITADELSAENKHLKEENEGLIAENRLLKSKLELLLSYGDSKAEAEPSSRSGKPMEQKAKQDYSNLGARRAQATDGHRAMREQISESTKNLKDLIPACNKVQGALLLDEIFSYVQSLQREIEVSVLSPGRTGILSSDSVESPSLRQGMQSRSSTLDQLQFLSLEPAAINPGTNPAFEAFPLKDFMDVDMNEFQNLLQMILVNADLNPTKPEVATCCNDEMPISDLLTKIEADEESKGKFSDFDGLDGDRIKHGKYSFPHSLIPTLETIIDACGDISATSKMNPSITEMVYIMFCASVKEMNDLRLEEITEDRILKWRDAIKDALRISFKVDFAMEHLKKIACAYIGQIERQKLKDLAMRISRLEDDLNFRKQELAKAYKQSKVYIDVADKFNGKLVSWGMFQSCA
ncbi:hypothetical protein Gohar_016552 [Gossypium harknessii]|uniref:BHLH domain-containing protein n=1 Tax=Gossypium harknessii TaxID=34285 RepID=A0A7J9G3K5_9ROSI|nr:hypothetical protein [Gossypium harknessii]